MRISDWSSDVCSSDLVTPWQVHAKYGNANLLVWVTAMASGGAVADADVAVIDGWHGAVLASGRSDASGLVQLPGSGELDPQLQRQYVSTRDSPHEPLVLPVPRGHHLALSPPARAFHTEP